MSVVSRDDGQWRLGPQWAGAGRIRAGEDVAGVLAAVNAAGQARSRTSDLAEVAGRANERRLATPDASRVLAVASELQPLFPWPGGIRRGATVSAVGSTSLLLALLSGAMTDGAWAAVVGIAGFGALAAAEYGIDLARVALVPNPGPDWPTVLGALIDGITLVVIATPADVPAGIARSLISRTRQRGAVLITTREWPGCDLTVRVTERRWHGLGIGQGRLRRQELTLTASGKGRAARPTTAQIVFPPPSMAATSGPAPGEIPGRRVSEPAFSEASSEATGPAGNPSREEVSEPWRDLVARLTS